MAKADSIDAFPSDIDRDAFGHWLSGFADGEGHFALRLFRGKGKRYYQPTAFFRIAIRDDDLLTLQLIQSFWQCGTLQFYDNRRSKITNAKPYASYQVTGRIPMHEILVPHFVRYPLRSKKANDFAIWRQGVELMAVVQQQPDEYRRVANRGRQPKWRFEQREHFRFLCDSLRSQRNYKGLRSAF